MSKEDREELLKRAKETLDESRKDKLNKAVETEEQTVEFLREEEGARLEKENLVKNQTPTPRPMPQWLTPAAKAVLNLVGFDNKKFNESNFIALLGKMGISKLNQLPNKAGYSINYGNNKFAEINIKQRTVSTNDFSPEGFTNAAKLVRASGATGLDMSQFIKLQAKNPHLDQMLTDAYKAAKTEGLTLVGMGEKQDLFSKLQTSSPFETPKLTRE